MTYFITTKNNFNFQHPDIQIVNNINDAFDLFVTSLNKHDGKLISFDVETTGLDPIIKKLVTETFCINKDIFIFLSAYANTLEFYKYLYKQGYYLLGSNIKFDISFILKKYNFLYTKVADVMIAEQRLTLKSNLSCSLKEITKRYLNINIPKEETLIFTYYSEKDIIITDSLLKYIIIDVIHLLDIFKIQIKKLKIYKLFNYVFNVEFNLISILAKAEVEGFDFDLKKWIKIAESNRILKKEIIKKLDIELIKLKTNSISSILFNQKKWKPKRNFIMYDNFLEDNTTKMIDLFGEVFTSQSFTGKKQKIEYNEGCFNYSSDLQIIEIFGTLNEPLYTKNNTIGIPQFNKNYTIINTGYSVSKSSFIELLNKFPNSKMKNFINLLYEYRELDKAITTYGFKYKNYVINNKIYTSFRQCATDTGRMSSGQTLINKPNFQNIPSKSSFSKQLRSCFISPENYNIGTHDYSGAELVILIAMSKDAKLRELSKKNMHSHFASICSKAIFKFQNKSQEFIDNFVITQEIRTKFKPVTFGVIYGAHEDIISKVLNISLKEAKIVIETIKNEIPKTFQFINSIVNFMKKNGYLIFNDYSNTFAVFNYHNAYLKDKSNYEFYKSKMFNEINEARNICIQGTQSDFIKESSVEIQKYINQNDIDAVLLSWVHDEIIDKHHIKHEQGLTYKDKTNLSFGEVKSLIMKETAERYLKGEKISVEYNVKKYWTK